MTTPAPAAESGPRLDWRQVGILYRRELRAALREKTIVINSILIPALLYPFLLWAVFTAMMFVMGQTEGVRSRVVVAEWPKEHPGLRREFERQEQLQLLAAPQPTAVIDQKIRNGEIEAGLEFLPPGQQGAALPGNFEARVTFNQSKDRSVAAKDRLTEALGRYRGEWLKREARARGLAPAAWQGFTLASRNVASKKQMGSFILGLIAPIIFVSMVAVGCFYPAVDAMAGERERHTWETLMSTAATRGSILTAKYLYVVTMGGLAGALNLLAILVTLRPIFGPLLERAGSTLECAIPLAALPLVAVAGVLLAGFIAAGMMIFASFARTFKEGQAMITPFYLLILVPIVFLQVPGLKFTLALALVPIVNLTMLIREAVSGVFHWAPLGVALVVSVLVIALCLRLATFIMQFEDVVVGSYSGSFGKFFRQRILKRAPPAPPAPEVTS